MALTNTYQFLTDFRKLAQRALLIFLLQSLIPSWANTPPANRDLVLMINGGISKFENHFQYYEDVKGHYAALVKRGIPRENIHVAYADGDRPEEDTRLISPSSDQWLFQNSSASLMGDGQKDIRYAADREGVDKAFTAVLNQLKPGDHLTISLFDHGMKDKGLVLWGGQTFGSAELAEKLRDLPNGVNVTIITNVCYGGQFLELTSSQVCVLSAADAKGPCQGNLDTNQFYSRFNYALGKRSRKTDTDSDKSISLREAFLYATQTVATQPHQHQWTSMDWFMQQNQTFVEDAIRGDIRIMACRHGHDYTLDNPIRALYKEVDFSHSAFDERGKEDRKAYYRKTARKKIDELKKDLEELANINEEGERIKLAEEVYQLEEEWKKMTPQEQNKKRGALTKKVDKLKSLLKEIQQRTDDLRRKYHKALLEMHFLRFATDEQFRTYENINRCMDHEY